MALFVSRFLDVQNPIFISYNVFINVIDLEVYFKNTVTDCFSRMKVAGVIQA